MFLNYTLESFFSNSKLLLLKNTLPLKIGLNSLI